MIKIIALEERAFNFLTAASKVIWSPPVKLHTPHEIGFSSALPVSKRLKFRDLRAASRSWNTAWMEGSGGGPTARAGAKDRPQRRTDAARATKGTIRGRDLGMVKGSSNRFIVGKNPSSLSPCQRKSRRIHTRVSRLIGRGRTYWGGIPITRKRYEGRTDMGRMD